MKIFLSCLFILVVVETINGLTCRQKCQGKPRPALCRERCKAGKTILVIFLLALLQKYQYSMRTLSELT